MVPGPLETKGSEYSFPLKSASNSHCSFGTSNSKVMVFLAKSNLKNKKFKITVMTILNLLKFGNFGAFKPIKPQIIVLLCKLYNFGSCGKSESPSCKRLKAFQINSRSVLIQQAQNLVRRVNQTFFKIALVFGAFFDICR